MYSKNMECYYCKTTNFLKVRGLVNDKIKKVSVSFGGQFLGDASINIYAHGYKKRPDSNITNYVFVKVMKKRFLNRFVTLNMYNSDGKAVKQERIKIKNTNLMPKEFTSFIGTKNGITVNENEDEFVNQQRECGFKPGLRMVHIETSSLCNLRCQYCVVSNNYERIERSVISDEVLSKALKDINQMPSINTIQLNGLGEPFTNRNFTDACWRIAKETNIKNIWLFTNGMLLTEDIADRLAEIPLNFKIFFSIDGNTPEENNFYRAGSDYEIIKKNAYYFLKKVAGKSNFRIKIHNLLVDTKSENQSIPKFLLNDFGFIGIDTHRAFYFPQLSHETLEKNNVKVHSEFKKKVCKRVFRQATIRSNGDIIRCHWDSTCEIVMGNILKEDLKDIWHGEKYIEQRKIMMPDTPKEELPEVCKACHAMNQGYLYKE